MRATYPCGRRTYCGSNTCRHAATCVRMAKDARAQPAATNSTPQPKKKLAAPASVVFIYDGSLQGFFCCVHECVYSHQLPCAIVCENDAEPTMFETRLIETDAKKADDVLCSIPKKISERALEIVQTVFLSCLEEKELALLNFLLLGYESGRRTPYMLGHPHVATVLDAEKHLGGEAHLLRGFVRFSDYNGFLGSTISPKNFILPFIQKHFVMRYSSENFMIYDKTHKAALIYENRKARIVPLEGIDFPEADENEEKYRALWKQFYNTIAIEARENPRCRMTHMPKRYWENMLEVKDLL